MRHGCDKRCPKVREQLKKAREAAREETDDDDSSSTGPSTGQKTKNGFSKGSKQSSRYPSGAASPTKTVGTPQRSQHTLARGSPVRSHRRSKESRRSKGYPSGHGDLRRSADPSRTLDPEVESTRRSHESELNIREQQSSEKKKPGASPKSPRNGRYDPNEHKTGVSSRSDTAQRIPDYARGLKRGAAGKGRKKIVEDDDEERAGPSRKTRSRKEDGEKDEDASEEHLQKWSSGAHDRCESHCRARDERMRRPENEKQRKEEDDYLLHKNLPYFEDLCNCCYECLTNQLWKDRFVKSTVASVAVFALGLKLCWDLDGWTIPNPL